MFGPLPRFHRLVIAGTLLAVSVVVGVWVGANPQVPVVTSAGVVLGIVVGAALAWLTVHESRRERAALLRTQRRR
ncbi:hypothetical protein [Nocardioides jishulii]|uniref:Uncharacterized protein n=1 Tax=Nocardioides jishulii TaxID=2575440 RepID=A0A4U2YLV9_9ACTN|nr:hypothetical protein [Nocardioides jishulii]QCX27101.1 hypothetical protein FCL41_05835 [Nocardioides jishulii]TKI61585.1 hypothetical protein FC770_12470 [Nocardioides jishulii]